MEESHFINEHDIFLLDSFKEFSNIIIEKELSTEGYKQFLNNLLEFFKPIKENRTIYDVDNAMEYLENKIDLKEFKELSRKDIEKESKNIREAMDNLIKQNEDKIKQYFDTPVAKEMINYWIINLDNILTDFRDGLEYFLDSKRMLMRRSRRGKDFLLRKFMDFLKAVFLAMFRILEQMILIVRDEQIDIDKEISLLISDVVYLSNMKRKLGEDSNKF